MPLHLSARLHAAVHGLFRPKDEKIVQALYEKVSGQFAAVGLTDDTNRTDLIIDIAADVAVQFGLDGEDDRYRPIHNLTKRLFDYEGLFLMPKAELVTKTYCGTVLGYPRCADLSAKPRGGIRKHMPFAETSSRDVGAATL